MARDASDYMSVYEVAALLRLPPAEVEARRAEIKRPGRKPMVPKPHARRVPSQPSVAAYRKRKRQGLAVYKLALPEYEIAQFLMASKRLDDFEVMWKANVELALAEVLVELAARWADRKKV
jgi:hypothetical protein